MEKITQPRILSNLFPLYQKHYVIQDSEEDIWFFKEKLHNGSYCKYTLSGNTVGYIFMRSDSYLKAKLWCMDDNQEVVSVFLEDMISGKRRKHIGSWLINRLITFLKEAGTVIQVDKIYGHSLPNEVKEAEIFYRRFGFDIIMGPNNRKIVIASLDELRFIFLPDVKEIPIEKVVEGWAKTIKG